MPRDPPVIRTTFPFKLIMLNSTGFVDMFAALQGCRDTNLLAVSAARFQRILSSGDGRDYSELRAIVHSCREIVQESHIFAIHVDVDESSKLSAFLAQSRSESRILAIERLYYFGKGAGRHFDGVGISC